MEKKEKEWKEKNKRAFVNSGGGCGHCPPSPATGERVDDMLMCVYAKKRGGCRLGSKYHIRSHKDSAGVAGWDRRRKRERELEISATPASYLSLSVENT